MVRAIYSSRAAQHHNPVPNAAVRNGLMMTSGILGKDLETDDYPKEREKQVALVFKHVVAILEDAGAGLQDVIKVDLYFADKTDRTMANQHWERLWPDPAHRPARQAHQVELPQGCCLQAAVTAMLAEPK